MKNTYKLTPINQYNIPGLESWLEDLATQGLFLKKFRPLFCTFTKGEPKRTRYRVELHSHKSEEDLPRPMLELYQDFGWDYVGEAGHSMFLFSTQDLHAPELHTDPETQAEQWNLLHKDLIRTCWRKVFRLLIWIILMALILHFSGEPLWLLMSGTTPMFILIAILSVVELPSDIINAKQIGRIAKQLRDGVPLDHRTVYPRRSLRTLLGFLVSCALLVILVLYQWVLPLNEEQNWIPVDELPFSPVTIGTLNDLDPSSNIPSAMREPHILCRDAWALLDLDTSGEDIRWLAVDWYDLRIPSLAVPLAEEQLQKATQLKHRERFWKAKEPGIWTTEDYQLDGVDYLVVARRTEGFFQVAAVAAGGKTAVVRYIGEKDLSDYIEPIADMVR